MRILLGLILLAGAPAMAWAQNAGPVLEALRRSFPVEHGALSAQVRGQPAAAQRRLAGEAMERFRLNHLESILAAPGSRLIALEVRHGAMLRALQRRDVRLCALLGDRGFLGPEARAAAPPPGLDDYAVAVIEAAAAGRGRPAPAAVTREDFQAWFDAVARREPNVPVRQMLTDRALRERATPEQMCAGAAAMHEAVADLPPERAARVAATLTRSALGVRPAATGANP